MKINNYINYPGLVVTAKVSLQKSCLCVVFLLWHKGVWTTSYGSPDISCVNFLYRYNYRKFRLVPSTDVVIINTSSFRCHTTSLLLNLSYITTLRSNETPMNRADSDVRLLSSFYVTYSILQMDNTEQQWTRLIRR